MIKIKLLTGVMLLSMLTFLLGACVSPTPSPPMLESALGTIEVYVTDAPPDEEITAVLLTISGLEIHRAVAEQEQKMTSDNETPEQDQEGEGEWITIDISDNMTTFDLLKVKGIEEFFGEAEVEAGKYTQMRLVVDKAEVALGDNEPQEAEVPSQKLKFVRPFDVVPGEVTTILIDFDADKSVTVTGAGKIIVKPVVKLAITQGQAADKDGDNNGTPTVQEGEQKPDNAVTGEASVEVSCDDFMSAKHISKEIAAAAGDTFTVTLCSNPTTGFTWSEVTVISDQTVMEQTNHGFVSPKAKGNKPPAPGTSGQEIWTFKAHKEGMSTISMEYSQPWEGGEKGEWTFELTVTVD